MKKIMAKKFSNAQEVGRVGRTIYFLAEASNGTTEM